MRKEQLVYVELIALADICPIIVLCNFNPLHNRVNDLFCGCLYNLSILFSLPRGVKQWLWFNYCAFPCTGGFYFYHFVMLQLVCLERV